MSETPWHITQSAPKPAESLLQHYVLFFRDGKQDCGWVHAIQKNRLLVLPMRGKELLLPANRVLFFWETGKRPKNPSLILEQLQEQFTQAQQFADALDLELIHELTEEAKTYTLKELIEDFADDPYNSLEALGFLFALSQDDFWFQSKRFSYTPRSAEELERLKAKQFREEKRQRSLQRMQGWIQALDTGTANENDLSEKETRDGVKQLESLLIHGQDSQYWKELAPVLNLKNMELSAELKVLRWLENAGHPISWSRLMLYRAGAKAEFTESQHLAAQEIVSSQEVLIESLPPSPSPSESTIFTIDSESTLDYDDAFSILEWDEHSVHLVLHIADVASALPPEHPLFQEAESRVSSVYAVEETLSMLPSELSHDYCSLKAGSPKKVISFFFRITDQGEWKMEEVKSQIIEVQENLSYTEADRRIEQAEGFWESLNHCCHKIREKREQEGALILEQKNFDLDISDPDQIHIVVSDSKSAANRLIEEMAILVNRETGILFQKNKIHGIYRIQNSFEIVREPAPDEKLSMEHIKIEAARFSTAAALHAGLACSYYIQVTSPIRRFVDLVCQHQLHSIIQQKAPVFEEEALMRFAEHSGMKQKQYNKATRVIVHHWKLRYLSQHLKEKFSAKIRKHWRENKTEIELLNLGCRLYVPGFSQYEEGSLLDVSVQDVDVRQEYVELKPAS